MVSTLTLERGSTVSSYGPYARGCWFSGCKELLGDQQLHGLLGTQPLAGAGLAVAAAGTAAPPRLMPTSSRQTCVLPLTPPFTDHNSWFICSGDGQSKSAMLMVYLSQPSVVLVSGEREVRSSWEGWGKQGRISWALMLMQTHSKSQPAFYWRFYMFMVAHWQSWFCHSDQTSDTCDADRSIQSVQYSTCRHPRMTHHGIAVLLVVWVCELQSEGRH